jgi:hypothetical protein
LLHGVRRLVLREPTGVRANGALFPRVAGADLVDGGDHVALAAQRAVGVYIGEVAAVADNVVRRNLVDLLKSALSVTAVQDELLLVARAIEPADGDCHRRRLERVQAREQRTSSRVDNAATVRVDHDAVAAVRVDNGAAAVRLGNAAGAVRDAAGPVVPVSDDVRGGGDGRGWCRRRRDGRRGGGGGDGRRHGRGGRRREQPEDGDGSDEGRRGKCPGKGRSLHVTLLSSTRNALRRGACLTKERRAA